MLILLTSFLYILNGLEYLSLSSCKMQIIFNVTSLQAGGNHNSPQIPFLYSVDFLEKVVEQFHIAFSMTRELS